MRLLHTSDWHLGHTLHDLPRDFEHARFLRWLLDLISERSVDALLIAGDVFETANPPATAQAAWYDFLAGARTRFPRLDIVVIGGNHDSAARLDAPAALLDAFGVRIVGGLPRQGDGSLDGDRLVAPLHGPDGMVEAWVCVVPFLRQADLPPIGDDGDPLIAGVRARYDAVFARARALRLPGQALVAMGHCYMVGTALSELSERRILGGNQHALPADLFPDDVAYAALGHLHLAQRVGGRDGVRYSGSPIPLSLAERDYRHQVCVVDLAGDRLGDVETVRIPRFVDMLQVGPGDLPAILRELRALPRLEEGEAECARPFLEVQVQLDRPDPTVNRQIVEAMEDKAARLVKITPAYSQGGRDVPGAQDITSLHDLQPGDVFGQMYARAFSGEPPADLRAAFDELHDAVRREEVLA